VFIKVPLAVLGISLLVLGALGKPVFELLRGIASAMV
jgi:multicomponent Na+:H+ antiporter subunit D